MESHILRIRITGVKPYDGEYKLDVSRFTPAEAALIEQITEVPPGELATAWDDMVAGGDVSVIVALAATAVRRKRRRHRSGVVDALFDAPITAFTFPTD